MHVYQVVAYETRGSNDYGSWTPFHWQYGIEASDALEAARIVSRDIDPNMVLKGLAPPMDAPDAWYYEDPLVEVAFAVESLNKRTPGGYGHMEEGRAVWRGGRGLMTSEERKSAGEDYTYRYR